MPKVTVTRRMHFNAAHRVHNPALSDAENHALFGKCNNPNWHGHNYVLDVSVTGEVSTRTGYVVDLAQLKQVVNREIIDKVDHRNLNIEVDFMQGKIPTTENIVVAMWQVIAPLVAPAKLEKLVLSETENNSAEYRENDGVSAQQVAVVTGASRGIGLATARRIAGTGAKVILVARDAGALARAAQSIGDNASVVACDVGDQSAVERAVASIRSTVGAPDILVNNAGLFTIAPVEKTTASDFAGAFQVNLFAPFLFIRAFLDDMKAKKAGHIVTIGSIADRNVFEGNAAYAATKFGARAMHQVLRAELKGSGVRATLVSPGAVNTDLWNTIDPDRTPGFTPRRDMLSPDAVADAVMFALGQPSDVNVDELRLSRS